MSEETLTLTDVTTYFAKVSGLADSFRKRLLAAIEEYGKDHDYREDDTKSLEEIKKLLS